MFEQFNSSENLVQGDDSELQNRAKSGANWFYWIAGASLVNTIIFLFNGSVSFIIGLGITQIVSGIALAVEGQTDSVTAPKIGVFLINLAISAVFATIGYFAGKRMLWAFVLGTGFYILDGLIFFCLKIYGVSVFTFLRFSLSSEVCWQQIN